MAILSPFLRSVSDNGLLFRCPGCKANHLIFYQGSKNIHQWEWNRDVYKPTFRPSILVRSSQLTELGLQQYNDWIKNNFSPLNKIFDNRIIICHSYITEGNIFFLSDCTHELANKTVALERFSQHGEDK